VFLCKQSTRPSSWDDH